MKCFRRTTAIAAAGASLALWSLAWAGNATQADFDACNAEARASSASPAASPGGSSTAPRDTTGSTYGSSSPQVAPPGTSQSAPSGDTGSRPSGNGSPSSGSISAGAGTSGSVSGSAGASSGGATGSMPGTSSGSGIGASAEGGASLQGMATAGASDPAYQQAYRECMRKRGF
jgi:hypothetical protein